MPTQPLPDLLTEYDLFPITIIHHETGLQIKTSIAFSKSQTWDLDQTLDESLFCSDFFFDRFSANIEPFHLLFNNHIRNFTSLDDMLQTLRESGYAVDTIEFPHLSHLDFSSAFFLPHPMNPDFTLSHDRGFHPEQLAANRELHNLQWPAPKEIHS